MLVYSKKSVWIFLFNVIVFILSKCRCDDEKSSEEEVVNISAFLGSLRNNTNVDQSKDEEYEDLRDELLAYHSALLKLRSSRRSMIHTPCWKLGGVCVEHNLCTGPLDFKSHVPGCMDKTNVCCLVWNRLKVRDFSNKGINNPALPWSNQHNFGGKGLAIVDTPKAKNKKKKKSKKLKSEMVNREAVTYVESDVKLDTDTEVENEKELIDLLLDY